MNLLRENSHESIYFFDPGGVRLNLLESYSESATVSSGSLITDKLVRSSVKRFHYLPISLYRLV